MLGHRLATAVAQRFLLLRVGARPFSVDSDYYQQSIAAKSKAATVVVKQPSGRRFRPGKAPKQEARNQSKPSNRFFEERLISGRLFRKQRQKAAVLKQDPEKAFDRTVVPKTKPATSTSAFSKLAFETRRGEVVQPMYRKISKEVPTTTRRYDEPQKLQKLKRYDDDDDKAVRSPPLTTAAAAVTSPLPRRSKPTLSKPPPAYEKDKTTAPSISTTTTDETNSLHRFARGGLGQVGIYHTDYRDPRAPERVRRDSERGRLGTTPVLDERQQQDTRIYNYDTLDDGAPSPMAQDEALRQLRADIENRKRSLQKAQWTEHPEHYQDQNYLKEVGPNELTELEKQNVAAVFKARKDLRSWDAQLEGGSRRPVYEPWTRLYLEGLAGEIGWETNTPSSRREDPSKNKETPKDGDANNHDATKQKRKDDAFNKGPTLDAIAQFPPRTMKVYVSCHAGLKQVLDEELTALGDIEYTMQGNGAEIQSITVDDLMRLHLYLGSASNIFLRCGEPFACRALGELKRKVSLMPWKEILYYRYQSPPNIRVKVATRDSKLFHTTAVRDRILEGVYEALGFPNHKPQSEEKEQEYTVIITAMSYRDIMQLSVDTSATPVHQRGYRLETAKAPLREDLAYAFLWSAGWRPKFALSSSAPVYQNFLDPFCGSGTIPIEAAVMARGLPPGRLREAPLKGTRLYDTEKWESAVEQAVKEASSDFTGKIFATDRDRGAVEITKRNAERAGVEFTTEACAFSSNAWLENASSAPNNLLVASNLPFGRRTKPGKPSKVDPQLPVYQRLATQMGSFADADKECDFMLLTDKYTLVQQAGFRGKLESGLTTKHGGIKVSGVKILPRSRDETQPNSATTKYENDTSTEWQTTSDAQVTPSTKTPLSSANDDTLEEVEERPAKLA